MCGSSFHDLKLLAAFQLSKSIRKGDVVTKFNLKASPNKNSIKLAHRKSIEVSVK